MYINFVNKSEYCFLVGIGKEKIALEPKGFDRVRTDEDKITFSAEMKPMELADGFEEDFKAEKFGEKIFYKLTKKFLEKIPEMQLNSTLTYEITDTKSEEITVTLEEGAYPICSGDLAIFCDMVPLIYGFARCESDYCTLRVLKAQHNNRKAYLKLVRTFLLFTESGFILPDLFFFLPKYLFFKVFTSNFCTARILGRLYRYTESERTSIILGKTQRMDSEDRYKKDGWFTAVKIILGILLFIALVVWANWDEIKLL